MFPRVSFHFIFFIFFLVFLSHRVSTNFYDQSQDSVHIDTKVSQIQAQPVRSFFVAAPKTQEKLHREKMNRPLNIYRAIRFYIPPCFIYIYIYKSIHLYRYIIYIYFSLDLPQDPVFRSLVTVHFGYCTDSSFLFLPRFSIFDLLKYIFRSMDIA